MSNPLDTLEWNKKYFYWAKVFHPFLCLFFQQMFFFILVPRTLDREFGTERKKPTHILWYGSFNEIQNIEIWKLKTRSPWVHVHLFHRLLINPLINNQLLTGGGFVWTDWGWGGVRPSPSDEEDRGETRGEAGGERSVRELEENNGTETSAGEEEVTTTSDAIEQGELLASGWKIKYSFPSSSFKFLHNDKWVLIGSYCHVNELVYGWEYIKTI